VTKEKALYHALNNMKSGSTTFIGFFWAPLDMEHPLREEIRHFPTTDFKRFESHTIKPPTYIKSNEFTELF
jgi:vacuolar-type H+-ATPase subunit I/STV1